MPISLIYFKRKRRGNKNYGNIIKTMFFISYAVNSALRIDTVSVEGSAEELEFSPHSTPTPLLLRSVSPACLHVDSVKQTL